uniref:Uncharacterized protein n=1 Tax=Arundo donax TaxID=35708 RepID=A0A0A9GSK3_ARUDO
MSRHSNGKKKGKRIFEPSKILSHCLCNRVRYMVCFEKI